jgi:hypothetical protein
MNYNYAKTASRILQNVQYFTLQEW